MRRHGNRGFRRGDTLCAACLVVRPFGALRPFRRVQPEVNGIENVSIGQGDLYDAVDGRTFDRIVAHPPYVPTPEQKILFRDGGQDGETILRRIVEGLSRHLRPGGRFYSFTLATDREDADYEQRVRGWLGAQGHEFDVFVVAMEVADEPDSLLKTALKSNRPAIKSMPNLEFLRRLKVTSVYNAITVIEKFAGARPAITARTRKAARATNDAVEWFIRWTNAGAAPEFRRLPARVPAARGQRVQAASDAFGP